MEVSGTKMKLEKGGELFIPTCFVITGYSICMPCNAKEIPINYPIVLISPTGSLCP
jgi:hypothetical protein